MVDAQGISNTVVAIYVLAFVIVLPVRHIPWYAVSCIDTDNDRVYIRVKAAMVDTSVFGKLLLAVFGYQFCYDFIKPKLSNEEIELISRYCHSKSSFLRE